jgi:hypothetical protein
LPSGISVVTPSTPPRAELLSKAMASMAAQTLLPEAHIVVVDHAGRGEAATRNRGLFAVDTAWTAFLDDDDELYPHHLSALMRHQETTGADLVYPWFDVGCGGTDPFPQREGVPFDEAAYRSGGFVPVTYLVRTELAIAIGGFPLPNSPEWPYPVGVDRGFIWRLLDKGLHIEHLNERTWRWNHHGGNYSGRVWNQERVTLKTGDGGPGWDHGS